ncbi:MAG: hypothetical protein ACLP3R_04005 [Candidatus Korobacteraceae bacterium]
MRLSLTTVSFLILIGAASAQPMQSTGGQPFTSFPISVSLADHLLIYLENGGTHDQGQLLAEQLRTAGNAEMERQRRAAEIAHQPGASSSPAGSTAGQGGAHVNTGPLQDNPAKPDRQ